MTNGELFQGIEGGEAPSQAAPEDTSVSDVSDGATACHSADQVEQQPDTPANAGRDAAEAERQSHGAKRRVKRAKLDVDFGPEVLPAVRARAGRLGLSPGVWVKAVVGDALHNARTEELDAAIAAALFDTEQRVQASLEVRTLASQIRPLAINVNDLDRRARGGEAVSLDSEVPELINLLRDVRELFGDRSSA